MTEEVKKGENPGRNPFVSIQQFSTKIVETYMFQQKNSTKVETL